MLIIERKMLNAISQGNNWSQGNTSVRHTSSGCDVFLHHNHIATVEAGEVVVNLQALKKWPTNTTKSRLRALGVDVRTVKGVTLLNGVDITTL